MSDVMAVMNEGKIVEMGPSGRDLSSTGAGIYAPLISAIPNDSMENIRRRQAERQAAQVAN